MKRAVPLLITALGGLALIAAYFIPYTQSWESGRIWFDVLAAIAFILGGGNLRKLHLKNVSIGWRDIRSSCSSPSWRRCSSGWARSGSAVCPVSCLRVVRRLPGDRQPVLVRLSIRLSALTATMFAMSFYIASRRFAPSGQEPGSHPSARDRVHHSPGPNGCRCRPHELD